MKENCKDGFMISDDKDLLQIDRIHKLLNETYWAGGRSLDTVRNSIEHSITFAAYKDSKLVGFARCVTDYSTMYWLCDVVIDEAYRGIGLGKRLVEAVVSHSSLKDLRGVLATKDAHGLYQKYGFFNADNFMRRTPA